MESSTELSALIRAAMRDKNLDRQGIATLLGIGDVMVDKVLCGDVVPSRSFEKKMIEKLGIAAHRVRRITDRRQNQVKQRMVREERTRKAA